SGAQLHRSEQRRVCMQQTFMHRREHRIICLPRKFDCVFESALTDCFEGFVQRLRPRAAIQPPPPDGTFHHDHERGDETKQNRPHNRAAPNKKINYDVGKYWSHERSFGRTKRKSIRYVRGVPEANFHSRRTVRKAELFNMGHGDGLSTSTEMTRPFSPTVKRIPTTPS